MTHCGWWTLTVLMAVTLVSCFSEVTGVTLSITSPIDITAQGGQSGGNYQLTASCSHTGGSVYVMEIGKFDQNNIKQAIVKVQPPNTDTVNVVDASLQPRITQISGSTSSGSLQFTLSDLVCPDAGRYYCNVAFGTASGGTEVDEVYQNVTARTYPGVITMDVYQDKVQYNVGDLIEFNCNGLIGNQFNENNLAGFWHWDWGSIDQSWTSYPNPNNITYETPTSAGNCQYNGSSKLFHTVTSFDNGRRFRCYVLNNAVNASEKTVDTQIPPVTDRPCSGYDVCQYPLKYVYCTQHTQSSVSLQWIYNGTKCSSFRFHLQFHHKEETNWKSVNVTSLNAQQQTLHTVNVTQLQSDSLIYFRLSADGGQTGQCEAVVVTCYTRSISDSDESCPSSLGVGIAIGVGVMMLCGGLCLIIAFIYRRRVAAAGPTKRTSGTMNLPQTQAPTTAETEMNQTAGGEYEMPGNFYDGLQERNVDVPSPYDKLKTYQNT